MLFNKTKTTNTLPALTAEKAQEIYVGLQTKDANRLFLEDNIPTEYTVQVEKEINRLESEIILKVSGRFLLEAKIPATYTEKGEIDKAEVPAVYFKLTTKAALIKTVSSELLNLDTLCSDIEDYYSEYSADRNFTDFVSLVTNE